MRAQTMHPHNSNDGLFWTVLAIIVGCVVVLTGCGVKPTSPAVKASADASLPAQKPTAMVFHAKWCEWCPTDKQIEAWGDEYPGVYLYNVDVDDTESQGEVEANHVKRIPHFTMWDAKGKKHDTLNRGEFEGWLQAQR